MQRAAEMGDPFNWQEFWVSYLTRPHAQHLCTTPPEWIGKDGLLVLFQTPCLPGMKTSVHFHSNNPAISFFLKELEREQEALSTQDNMTNAWDVQYYFLSPHQLGTFTPRSSSPGHCQPHTKPPSASRWWLEYITYGHGYKQIGNIPNLSWGICF